MKNREWNVQNPAQNLHDYKRVLCVCAAGLLRSPTAAVVLAGEPFNYNTRACGMVEDYALIPIDDILIKWADEIVVMDSSFEKEIRKRTDKPIINLDISDSYVYRDPDLMKLIHAEYTQATRNQP